MEFGLREYLLILGSILIVGLLVDGIRRTIKHRREGLKLDLIAAPPESPTHTSVSPPRPVKRATPEDLEPKLDRDPLFDSGDASQLNLWAAEIKPETMKPADQKGLQEPLADLAMDPLFDSPTANESSSEPAEPEVSAIAESPNEGKDPVRTEPVFELPEMDSTSSDAATGVHPENATKTVDSHAEHEADMAILTEGPMSAPIDVKPAPGLFAGAMGRLFGLNKSDSATAVEPQEAATDTAHVGDQMPPQDASGASVADVEAATPDLNDVVIIQVRPARSERFVGVNLHTACLRAGLRRTEHQVYERIPMNQSSQALFSLVNAVEPGIFPEDAKSIDANGFFLFTQLSKQTDPVFAVNELISGARSIAREIGGDIYDEANVAISKEWIDLARAKAGHRQLMRS